MMGSNNGVRSCFPFTATQWQELENQAQVYKCMVNGTPVPSELLFTIRRSLDSSLSSTFFFNQAQQPIGWNRFHIGFGRKIDPEPGRCRRTDGKKWRCSKEAYPDSKYCERHMHRGRNRSRKPVELLSSSSSQAAANAIPINSLSPSISKKSLSSYSSSGYLNPRGGCNNGGANAKCNEGRNQPHLLYPLLGLSSSSMESTANFFLGANSQSRASDKDYKELSQFIRGSSSSLSEIKQRSYSSDLQYHYSDATNSAEGDEDDDHHQPKKVMHHFLDEWPRPPKDNKDLNWLKSEDKMSASHTTHLSISVPSPMHDFFTTHK